MKFAAQIFNTSHHTLLMLLHYLGKLKSSNLLQIRKMQKDCINSYMRPFNVA